MDAFPAHLKATGPATPPPLCSQPEYSLPNYKDNLHVHEENKIISANILHSHMKIPTGTIQITLGGIESILLKSLIHLFKSPRKLK